MDDLTSLAGRQWISSQEDFSTSVGLTKIDAISDNRCNRCGAMVYAQLPNNKKYCRACIGVGRVVEGDLLVRNMHSVTFPKLKDGGLTWHGELTQDQAKIARTLVRNFAKRQDTLVHAVTGAGKTEMLFPLIAECLAGGRRCCIATPRIDVVNELYPRLQTAFAEVTIGKYHGREFKQPALEQLTICTTHQLLKFFQAFDLLVIDEVDAFPYVADPQLHFAAHNAVKQAGVRVYLTATPTKDLLEEVRAGRICKVQLKRRFHGHLLPVPQEAFFLQPFLKDGRLHQRLAREIIQAVKKHHPLLLFVARIDQIPSYLAALRRLPQLKNVVMAGVYAADQDRLAKIQRFRTGELQILVTTTILERGVTFKKVWVIVVNADDPIFTESSLVQIAGRVGRAQDDASGLVLFCYHKYTASIRGAMKQIREMNR